AGCARGSADRDVCAHKGGGYTLAKYNGEIDGSARGRVCLPARLVDGHSRLSGIDGNSESSRRDRRVAGSVFGLSGNAVIARREIDGDVPVPAIGGRGCAERGEPVKQFYGAVLFCGAAEPQRRRFVGDVIAVGDSGVIAGAEIRG